MRPAGNAGTPQQDSPRATGNSNTVHSSVPLTPLQQQQLQRQSQLFELQRLQQQQQQQQQQQRLPPQMTPDAVNSTQYRHSSPLQSTSQYANNMTALQQQHGQSIPSRIIPADTFTRLYPQFCHQCQLNPPQMPIVEYYRLYAQCQLVGGFPAIRQNLQLAGRVMASSTYFAQSTNLAQFLQFYQTYLYDFEVYARRLITEQQNRVAARHVDGGVAVGSAVPSPHASPQQRVRMPSVSASSSTNQPPTKPSLTPSQQPSQLVKKRKERVRRPIESYGGIEVDKMNRLLNGAGEGFTRRELACKEDLAFISTRHIIMGLKSQLRAEVTNALHMLLVLSYDMRNQLFPFDQCPELPGLLLGLLQSTVDSLTSSPLFQPVKDDESPWPWPYRRLFEWEMDGMDDALLGNAFSQSDCLPNSCSPLVGYAAHGEAAVEELMQVDRKLKSIHLILSIIRNWSFDNSTQLTADPANRQLFERLFIGKDGDSDDKDKCLSLLRLSPSHFPAGDGVRLPKLTGLLEIRKHLLIIIGNLSHNIQFTSARGFDYLLRMVVDFIDDQRGFDGDAAAIDEYYDLSNAHPVNALVASAYSDYTWYGLDLLEKLSVHEQNSMHFERQSEAFKCFMLTKLLTQLPMRSLRKPTLDLSKPGKEQELLASPEPYTTRWYELSAVETALSTVLNFVNSLESYQCALFKLPHSINIISYLFTGSSWADTQIFVRDPAYKSFAVYRHGLASMKITAANPVLAAISHYPGKPTVSSVTIESLLTTPAAYDSFNEPIVASATASTTGAQSLVLSTEERLKISQWFVRFSLIASKILSQLSERPECVQLLRSSYGGNIWAAGEERYLRKRLIEYDISSTTTAESEDYSLLLADTTTMEQQDQIAAFGRLLIDDNEAVADYAWNGGQGLAKSVGDTEALVMSLATNSRMPKESWMAACDILYRISTAASVDDV